MSYRIIADSCCELTEEMRGTGCVISAPLTLHVGEESIVDNDSFSQSEFLRKVRETEECPKSACPSPKTYMKGYDCDADHIYAVTLSGELSGSYNSAVLGKNLFEEKNPERQIHIFNSKSASIGETLIVQKIMECEQRGMPFEEVVATVEAYIAEQHTYFVLETLDMLRKNGRLTGIKALVATALNIKPVMGSTPEGTIQQIGQARGINKALKKMIEAVVSEAGDARDKVIAISHCNCSERAEMVKKALEETLHPREMILLDTRGVSSLYAADGGIIVVV